MPGPVIGLPSLVRKSGASDSPRKRRRSAQGISGPFGPKPTQRCFSPLPWRMKARLRSQSMSESWRATHSEARTPLSRRKRRRA